MAGESHRWEVGGVRIARLADHQATLFGAFLVPEFTPENVRAEIDWLAPHFASADGRIGLSFHSLLVESAGQKIVIDTCMGNHKARPAPLWDPQLGWDMRQGDYLDGLVRAGFAHESVDLVVLTHLHGDHVGWNTMLEGGRWVPTFPNARYLIVREEWEFWSRSDDPHFRIPLEDSVRPVIEAEMVEWVGTRHRINGELRLEPTPGHTHAHVSVVIESGGTSAITTGDLIHHPLQCAHPDWNCRFDLDPAQARTTRWDFLRRSADRALLVFGTHFPSPSAGRVVRHGGAFQFIPDFGLS
ncbi:MAG TPA: MBL fold metallo-hydrolase [Candidatus Binataceae bacterium]|nr:MBL fold metallo-hydrolase [Candidatus Binataceae bacterium]